MRAPYKCGRCDLINPIGTSRCQACGFAIMPTPPAARTAAPAAGQGAHNMPTGVTPKVASPTFAAAPAGQATASPAPVFAALGQATLDGRVTQVDATYMSQPDFKVWPLILKLVLWAVAAYYFGALILIALGVALLVLWLISKLLPAGLITGVAVQVISFVLTRRLMGPVASIPTRDVRVRDGNGQDHLVRLKGHLQSGSISVGDEVTITGWRRSGTLVATGGFNRRVNARLVLKQ